MRFMLLRWSRAATSNELDELRVKAADAGQQTIVFAPPCTCVSHVTKASEGNRRRTADDRARLTMTMRESIQLDYRELPSQHNFFY